MSDNVDTIARVLFRAFDNAKCAGQEPTHDFDVFADSAFNNPGRDALAWLAGWHGAARAAITLGAFVRHTDLPEQPHPIKQPGAAADRLAQLTDPTNFLGTGLSTQEFVQLGHAEKLAASWAHQPREERKRRLGTVMRLSVELTRVTETTTFSTRLAELAIESVIEGDRKMVEEWAEHFAFADEGEELRQKYAPIFAIFRELLLQALRAAKEVPA